MMFRMRRPTFRHRHVPLHRHRGVDAAAPGAGRRVCGGACRAPPCAARRLAAARGDRGRHAGRRVLRRFRDVRPMRVAAAAEAQLALAGGPVRVRMGLHTGEPLRADEGYVGFDVTARRGSRPPGAAGRCSLSQATVDLAGVDVRDLGLHRLKDLSAPERLFQLGTEDFPPLKTLHETNLPIPATPFLGREREVDQIAALPRRPDVRLVTLTGPGGTARRGSPLQAAAAASGRLRPRGVVVASLRLPTRTRRDGRRSGARVEGHALVNGRRQAPAARAGQLRASARAAAGVAETIGSCPHVTVLVTSREPWTLTVSGMSPSIHCESGTRSICSCTVPWPSVPISPQTARSPRSADASTACRSRSNWLLHA